MEIERKFLISAPPEKLASYPVRRITQAYISTDPAIRVRSTDGKYSLTAKGEGRLAHEELNLEISREAYERLREKADGIVIKKLRHLIPCGEYTIELVGPADDSDVRQKLPVCKLSVSMDAYYNISGTVTMVMASGALDEAPRINFTGSPSLTIESSPTTDETDDEGIVSYTDVTNTIYKWTTKMSTME